MLILEETPILQKNIEIWLKITVIFIIFCGTPDLSLDQVSVVAVVSETSVFKSRLMMQQPKTCKVRINFTIRSHGVEQVYVGHNHNKCLHC